MAAVHEEKRFQQLVQRMDPQSRLLRTRHLTGGVSARVTTLEVKRPDGRTQKMIVRRHGGEDLRHNPDIARDEFNLLQIAHSRGLTTPAPLYYDQACDLFPTPFLVIEYVEGETEFTPSDLADYLLQAAAHLARINGVIDAPDLAFLPRQGKGFRERPVNLDRSLKEERIRDALESAWPVTQVNASVLLHGDFWPGNLLWRDGELVAVIDWEDATIGDPLADLANARLEILWAFGIDAMRDFTAHYESLTEIDVTHLPYWDLCAALRPCSKLSEWGLDPVAEKRMRERHQVFITQAFERLPI